MTVTRSLTRVVFPGVARSAFAYLSGIYKFTYGRFIGENWPHQSVYSPCLIGIGAAVALCALIPASWINRATGGRRFHL